MTMKWLTSSLSLMMKLKSSFKAGDRDVELLINTRAMSMLTRLRILRRRMTRSANRMSLWMTRVRCLSLLKTRTEIVSKTLRSS